jgi:hypothetical protein
MLKFDRVGTNAAEAVVGFANLYTALTLKGDTLSCKEKQPQQAGLPSHDPIPRVFLLGLEQVLKPHLL